MTLDNDLVAKTLSLIGDPTIPAVTNLLRSGDSGMRDRARLDPKKYWLDGHPQYFPGTSSARDRPGCREIDRRQFAFLAIVHGAPGYGANLVRFRG
jgi:hypothetical protein